MRIESRIAKLEESVPPGKPLLLEVGFVDADRKVQSDKAIGATVNGELIARHAGESWEHLKERAIKTYRGSSHAIVLIPQFPES